MISCIILYLGPSNEKQYYIVRALTKSINPYRAGTELTRFNYVNIMAADALAPYVARTSAAMILVM